MTGRQFSRIGVPGVFGPSVDNGLPLNETTVARLKPSSMRLKSPPESWHLPRVSQVFGALTLDIMNLASGTRSALAARLTPRFSALALPQADQLKKAGDAAASRVCCPFAHHVKRFHVNSTWTYF